MAPLTTHYRKGDFDNAVHQYIHTIGYLQPSYVISKVGPCTEYEFHEYYMPNKSVGRDKFMRMNKSNYVHKDISLCYARVRITYAPNYPYAHN
jgi:hypothetical protein